MRIVTWNVEWLKHRNAIDRITREISNVDAYVCAICGNGFTLYKNTEYSSKTYQLFSSSSPPNLQYINDSAICIILP